MANLDEKSISIYLHKNKTKTLSGMVPLFLYFIS